MRLSLLLPVVLLAAPVWSPGQIVIRKSGSIDVFVEATPADGNKTSNEVRRLLGETGSVKIVDQPVGARVVRATFDRDSMHGLVLGADGKREFKEDYAWPGDGGVARRFASDIIIALTGRPAVAVGTIAFSGVSDGKREIFACAPDGSNLRLLTQDHNQAESPSLSPDGAELTFTTRQPGYPVIDLLPLAKGSRKRIVSSPGANSDPVFSHDGNRLAFIMTFSGNADLYTARPGGRPHRVTTSPGVESAPSWSPDGGRLAYVYQAEKGNPQVFLTEEGGGVPVPVKSGYAWTSDPDWSPDGTMLALTVRRDGKPAVAVHVLATSQTTVVGPGSEPAWAPDSRHLACVEDGSLVLRDVVTGRKAVLVAGRGARQPSWTR